VVLLPAGNLSPNPVLFGNRQVGVAGTAAVVTFNNTTGAPITLRAGNSNNQGSANGPAVGLTGGNNGDFSIGTGTTCTNGAVIATGGSCVINLVFTPGATGARASTLNVYIAGTTAALATDAVSGTGVQGTVAFGSPTLGTLTGSTLALGAQTGTVFSTVTVTVGGTAPVTFTAVTVATNGQSGAFTKSAAAGSDTCTGQTIAVGGTCTITISFNGGGANANNNRTGTLTVTDNASGSPQVLTLTGN
jgi:hypothetical protein